MREFIADGMKADEGGGKGWRGVCKLGGVRRERNDIFLTLLNSILIFIL